LGASEMHVQMKWLPICPNSYASGMYTLNASFAHFLNYPFFNEMKVLVIALRIWPRREVFVFYGNVPYDQGESRRRGARLLILLRCHCLVGQSSTGSASDDSKSKLFPEIINFRLSTILVCYSRLSKALRTKRVRRIG